MSFSRVIAIGFVASIAIACIAADSSNKSKEEGIMSNSVKSAAEVQNGKKLPLACGEYLCQHAVISNSTFDDVGMENCSFENVLCRGTKIHNACMTNMNIDYIQLAGTSISNIISPEDQTAKSKGISITKSYLADSKFVDCNLENAQFKTCNFKNATIDGISISDLLESYKKNQKK